MADLDLGRFHDDLDREDDLGVVIRAHIHVENKLNQVIDGLAANPKPIRDMRLDYAHRVDLALVLGLNPVFKAPLLALGRLRNEFAHQLTADLSDERVKNFFKTFDGKLRELINFAQNQARKQLGKDATPTLRELPPKEVFIRCAIVLYSALTSTIDQLTEHPQAEGRLSPSRESRFTWEAADITVRNPAGEVIDISKKPEEKEPTGKDVVPKPPDEK